MLISRKRKTDWWRMDSKVLSIGWIIWIDYQKTKKLNRIINTKFWRKRIETVKNNWKIIKYRNLKLKEDKDIGR